jgi:hypothetical protein
MKYLILALTITGLALAEGEQTYDFQCGFIDQEDSINRKNADVDYIKGDKMFLCLHLFPFGLRLPYQLVVDEYNMIEVKDCKLPPSFRPI